MYLYFENSRGEYQYIGETTPEEVGKMIGDFIHERNPNYKMYYTRAWGDAIQGFTYDVGSWVEFFHLLPRPYKGSLINT